MIVGVIVVVGGWLAYFIWDYKQRKEEQQQPKPQSARVQKTKSEVSDWAKKMAEFKSPAPKRPAGDGEAKSG
jgi:heme/copper-type cytochrome/quinol oxidase subunit 2